MKKGDIKYYKFLETFEYDFSGTNVVISIIPTLSPKKAHLIRQKGFTLFYQGEDLDYRFEQECWPDMVR